MSVCMYARMSVLVCILACVFADVFVCVCFSELFIVRKRAGNIANIFAHLADQVKTGTSTNVSKKVACIEHSA